jgi:hypothetical protein
MTLAVRAPYRLTAVMAAVLSTVFAVQSNHAPLAPGSSVAAVADASSTPLRDNLPTGEELRVAPCMLTSSQQ